MFSKLAVSVSRRVRRVTSTHNLQKRLKMYLVGVDGSQYGYCALKSVADLVKPTDSIISIHFPSNFSMSLADANAELIEEWNRIQAQRTEEVKTKCSEIIKNNAPNNDYQMKIGKIIFSAQHELVKACFDEKADALCVGSKGISHGFREKLADKLHGVGHVADYCVHNAPCDVMVFKEEHDNI